MSAADAGRSAAIMKSPLLPHDDAQIEVTSSSLYLFPGTVTVTITYEQEIPIIQRSVTLRASSTAKLEQ